MDIDKFIKKYRILVILGVLALAFLAIKFGMKGGQSTEVDFSPGSGHGFRTSDAQDLRHGDLRNLPFDGAGINDNSQ